MITTTVSQPDLAAIRFQFWKDALASIWTGKTADGTPSTVPQHPVAVLLNDMRQHRPVQRYYLSQMIDSRVRAPAYLLTSLMSPDKDRQKHYRPRLPHRPWRNTSNFTAHNTRRFSSDPFRSFFPQPTHRHHPYRIPYHTSLPSSPPFLSSRISPRSSRPNARSTYPTTSPSNTTSSKKRSFAKEARRRECGMGCTR